MSWNAMSTPKCLRAPTQAWACRSTVSISVPSTSKITALIIGAPRFSAGARLAVFQLEEQDRAGEHEGDTVGRDERDLAFPEPIDEPEREARHKHQKHLERNVLRGP